MTTSKAFLSGTSMLSLKSLTSAGVRGKARGSRITTSASLLGVGTPEVLVIGVVALLVFGPKGLADAAKSLGKTLRTFQPTIQELKEVSEEFKSTLEDEIGLDEFQSSIRSPPSTRPYSAKDEAKEESIDEMRQKSLEDAWTNNQQQQQEEVAATTSQVGNEKVGEKSTTFAETLSAPTGEAAKAGGESAEEQKDLSTLSVEELQAELERRKKEESSS
jgi:TatA/E family protein of Tat protein translocase